MTSVIQGGYGATVKIGSSVVGHATDIEFPEFERTMADITAHDTSSGYASWIPTGIRKMNAFKMTVVWSIDETAHSAIQANFVGSTASLITVADPNAYETISFSGFVSKIGRVVKMEDGYKADITIQPTGVPTITVT